QLGCGQKTTEHDVLGVATTSGVERVAVLRVAEPLRRAALAALELTLAPEADPVHPNSDAFARTRARTFRGVSGYAGNLEQTRPSFQNEAQIGRASCRERVWGLVVEVHVKNRMSFESSIQV